MDWGNSDSSESDRDRMHKQIEIFNRFFINFISWDFLNDIRLVSVSRIEF